MKKLPIVLLLLIEVVALLLTACGREGPLPPPDPTPPVVLTTDPVNGALSVPLNTSLTFTFSKQMQASTFNDSTVSVVSNYVAVTGTFTCTDSVVVFKPDQNLSPNTQYTVTISSMVTDIYGIPMSNNASIVFSTAALPPPRVVDILPANRSKNISPATTVSILFSQPMDPTTITTGAIRVSNVNGDVLGNVYYNTSLAAAVFTPYYPGFINNTNYSVTVSPTVKSATQSSLADAFVASFQTGASADTTPPSVASTFPAAGDTAVSVNAPISVTFSEPMDLSTVTPAHFLVSQGTDSIPGTLMYFGTSAIFSPSSPFKYATTYTVTVTGNHAPNDYGVMDLSDNSLATDYTWSFTTEAQGPDTVPPTVLMTFPTSSQTNVPIYNQVVALFSKSMLASSITPSTFSVADQNGNPVAGDIKTTGAVAVFTPRQVFAYNTSYSALITPGAVDVAGNTLAGNTGAGYGWPFTTEDVASFTILASAGPNGIISPSGSVGVNLYSNQTFTIIPNTGYHIADVQVDGVSVGPVSSYTYNWVTSDHTIKASFAINTFTITPSVASSNSGTISPAGPVTVNYGASQTFTITPATGYHIADVQVDGVSQGAVTAYTFGSVTASHTISATFALNTFTVTPSVSGANGTMSPLTVQLVSYGSTTTFTLSPAAGYSPYMSGTCGGTLNGNIYTTSPITGNCTVIASFSINSNAITASAGTGGTISPTGMVPVNYGANQTFTITPNANYQIASVLVDGVSQGAIASYTFSNVTSSHSISATFTLNTFTIAPSAGTNGTINPATPQIVTYGSSTTFTFTPSTGYYVSSVLVDGANVGLPNSYTFSNVTTNHTIAVSFALGSYTITATAGAGGTLVTGGVTISSGSSQDFLVSYGGSRSFTIVPNAGYSVVNVVVDGVSQGAITSYTFNNVTANHTISATFAINNYTVTSSVSGTNGTMRPTGSLLVSYGSTTSFTVTPATGYYASMSGTCGGTLNGTTYTTNPISANCTVIASFNPNPYTLTVTKSGTGTGSVTPNTGTISWNGNVGTASYSYSTSVVLTATADASSMFTSWTGCDSVSGNQCTVSITGARSVTAAFTLNSYTIIPSAGTNGTINPATTQIMTYGSSTTFAFTPSTGYYVSSVLVDGINVGLPNSYTFNYVTTNHTIAVSFALGSYTITATAGAGGTITSGGTIVSSGSSQDFLVSYGGSRSFTITPNDGYYITSVVVDGVSQGAITSYPFNNVTANHTISATFTAKTTATVTLASLNQTYDGTPKQATATTSPAGLNVTFTYNGSSTPPTSAGSYWVVGTINDPIYQGSASGTMTVNKATPTITWPTASSITYGQTLASSTLTGGSASTPGSFAWTAPGTAPGAGTNPQSVTFTPTDTTDYSTVIGTASVTVNKATPTITASPTASSITYGQALSSSTLSGGSASTAGSFAWTAPGTVPGAVGTYSESVTFTPTDTTNYSTASGTVSVTVNQTLTTTSLTASLNPANPGDTVTFTAKVTPTIATPTTATGLVAFYENYGTQPTLLGTGILSSGVAQYSTTSLSSGAHYITAVYGGDTNFVGSTSSVYTQNIN